MSERKPKSTPKQSNPIKTLTNFVKPYKFLTAFLVVLTLVATVLSLIIPRYTGYILDAAVKQQSYDDLVITMVILIAAALLVGVIQMVAGVYLSQKVAFDLRVSISTKISKQTFKFINKVTPPKLLSILTSDVDAVRELISQSLVLTFSSIFLILGAGALMLSINVPMALAGLLVIPVIGGAFGYVFKKLGPLFMQSRIIIDNLNRVISENIVAAGLIRVLNSQKSEITKLETYNTQSKELGLKILNGFAFMFPFVNLASSLGVVTVLYIGGGQLLDSKVTPGDFVTFFTYLGVLIFPIITLGFISNLISRAFISIERINEVLDSKVEEAKGTIEKEVEGKIEFRNVSLVLDERNILKNVSFTINPHQQSAIIGPTAAGKTQIMYLLTGLIEPTSGDIFIDDVNVKEYNLKNLYKQMGIVFQDSVIFNTTIGENIDFQQSSDNLDKVISTAELDDFISKLDSGLKTVINERGSNLSGGQKQRLTLARALAVNPKILLLDDFTARVDKGTEKRIFDNLKREYPHITQLVISQKIDSIKNFDKIVLIMEGEVLASGKHEELLNNSLEYKQIFESQQSTEN
jgi:ATP-binding cassette, subfamily B, bacterial